MVWFEAWLGIGACYDEYLLRRGPARPEAVPEQSLTRAVPGEGGGNIQYEDSFYRIGGPARLATALEQSSARAVPEGGGG